MGYGTLIPSSLKSPLITSIVRKEFHRTELYTNSYNVITAIAKINSWHSDFNDSGMTFTLSPASLVTQNHDTTEAIIKYVTSFGNP